MHVLKFAQNQSTYTTVNDLSFPPGRGEDVNQPWIGYDKWALHLARRGRYWEAINIVKILASTMPPKWSIETYLSIQDVIGPAQTSAQTMLSQLALCLALSRRYLTVYFHDQATQNLEGARVLLAHIEQELQVRCSRQRLELEIAKVEQLAPGTHISVSLQQWEHVADIAQRAQDWGIESSCLTTCAQISASNRDKDAVVKYSERLYVVENDIERDMVSVLSNKCGLWQAGSRSDLGELLNWFDLHAEQYPMLDFGSISQENTNLHQWDIPWSVARVAQLRYIMYSALQDSDRANAAKLLADNAAHFVPFDRLSEMGLLDEYMLEWFDPQSNGSATPFEVLGRRIRNHYSRKSTNDGSDWYRYRELEPSELQNIILCVPFDHERFMRKIESLLRWFSEDSSLDRSSSDYLIARLYLEHYSHAKLTAQSQNIKEEIIYGFGNFVNKMPQSSLEVHRQLKGNHLLALQENYDAMLGRPFQPVPGLPELRLKYEGLISQYNSSHLSDNLPAIGSIHGRIAEIDFRLAVSEVQLERAMETLHLALRYYEDYRASLSSLRSIVALEVKSYIRQSIIGDQELLQRISSVLMTKWLQRNIPNNTKRSISSCIWEIVQRNKNRALGDALSATISLSASDRATLSANAQPRKCFEDWRTALEKFSRALQDRNCEASKFTQLQRSLKAEEQRMSEDPFCAKILAFSKGGPLSMAEMGEVFAANQSKERVILVDWFTANVPAAFDKLFIVTLEVAPNLQSPVVLELELGIAGKILEWNRRYIQGNNAAQSRRQRAAHDELSLLAGLVQPLVAVSNPNDILVFCPTTKWQLHRVPLHAIKLRSEAPSGGAHDCKQTSLLFLRNRIVYTYSQSLLRLSVLTRQSEAPPQTTFTATLLSPLEFADDSEGTDIPASQNGGEISRRMTDLTRFLTISDNQTKLLTSTSVNKPAAIQAIFNSSFFAFLGHVQTASPAIKSRMVLYHPDPADKVGASSGTDSETFLSGEDIISRTQLQMGAHVVLLACGSGITEARVQDEVLGLVPAFFHSGARSVVATLWAVRIEAACTWLQAVQNCWESREVELRRQDRARNSTSWTKMIDLAEIFRSATKVLMESEEPGGIDSWAPFVYSGYWMYPRVHVDAFDSEDEEY